MHKFEDFHSAPCSADQSEALPLPETLREETRFKTDAAEHPVKMVERIEVRKSIHTEGSKFHEFIIDLYTSVSLLQKLRYKHGRILREGTGGTVNPKSLRWGDGPCLCPLKNL